MSSINFSSASKACPAQISPAGKAAGGQGARVGAQLCEAPRCGWHGGGGSLLPQPEPSRPPRCPQAFCSEGGWLAGGTLPTHPIARRCCSSDKRCLKQNKKRDGFFFFSKEATDQTQLYP